MARVRSWWALPGNDCLRVQAAGDEFGRLFVGLFLRGLGEPDPSPTTDVWSGLPAPLDVLLARSWVRLLGAVMVEVAGEYQHIGIPPEVVFEAELGDCSAMIVKALGEARR